MIKIGVATTSRADYSSLIPILELIASDKALELLLFVGGTHLVPEMGLTVKQIEADGFKITDRIDMMIAADTQQAIAKSIGLGILGFADSLTRFRPDILVIVGDRLEMLAVACTALTLDIPIMHVSGGDLTESAVDNQVRFALTKLSHLHCVAMAEHANRLIQLGEEPWRVHVTGDPALDLINSIPLLDRQQLGQRLGFDLQPPLIVATLHPTPLSNTAIRLQVDSLLSALDRVQGTQIFTAPNADAGRHLIAECIESYVHSRPNTRLVTSLGQQVYYSLLASADLMVGNSSSGIWEAPSFALPVVNIGERQEARHRASNVIDVAFEAEAIYAAILRALTPEFRASLHGIKNPYGDGQASKRIFDVLREDIDPHRLLKKKFIDLAATP